MATPITSASVVRATWLGGLAYFSTIMVLKGHIRFRNWEMTQRLNCSVCCNYPWPYTRALSWDIIAFAVIYWLQHLNAESLSLSARSKKCQWCGNVRFLLLLNESTLWRKRTEKWQELVRMCDARTFLVAFFYESWDSASERTRSRWSLQPSGAVPREEVR